MLGIFFSLVGIAIDDTLAFSPDPVHRIESPEGIIAEAFGEEKQFADEDELDRYVAMLIANENALGPADIHSVDGDEELPVAESTWTEGSKRILYLRVRFADQDPAYEPLTYAHYNYTSDLNPRGATPTNGLGRVEYGHRFSMMSAQSGSDFDNPLLTHFTAHEKWRLDWLTDSDVTDITSGSQTGTYRLYQNDDVDATGTRALRLPSGGSLSKYWLSHRDRPRLDGLLIR